MTEPEAVRGTANGGRFDIVIDRPHKRNALTAAMVRQFGALLDRARDDQALVVTVQGAGGHFCAGADVSEYADARDHLARIESSTRAARALCDRIEHFPGVVISSVRGMCFGGGLEIALASDVTLAADDARLGVPEIRLGLLPGWGGTRRLADQAGHRLAFDMIVSGRALTGGEAVVHRLATASCPEPDLQEATDAYADRVLASPAAAVRAAKRLMRDHAAGGGPEAETLALMGLFASEDGIEGVRAFLDKRPPVFGAAGGTS